MIQNLPLSENTWIEILPKIIIPRITPYVYTATVMILYYRYYTLSSGIIQFEMMPKIEKV